MCTRASVVIVRSAGWNLEVCMGINYLQQKKEKIKVIE
jgi:hypothetical protein